MASQQGRIEALGLVIGRVRPTDHKVHEYKGDNVFIHVNVYVVNVAVLRRIPAYVLKSILAVFQGFPRD